jgi:hypothetical protein
MLWHLWNACYTSRSTAPAKRAGCQQRLVVRAHRALDLLDIAVQKNMRRRLSISQRTLHHNSAIPVAAVEFIVYAE